MAQHVYGIDLGTSNIKMYSSSSDNILNEKTLSQSKIKMKFSALETRLLKCMKKHRKISMFPFR